MSGRAGTPLPFYRSSLTRWSFAGSGAFLAVMFSPLAPHQWRDTPSLRWLHQVLPWWLVTVVFAVYTLLLVMGDVRAAVVADTMGVVLWGWELVALLFTLQKDRPTNPFAIGGVFLVAVFHLVAARLALHQAARREQ